LPRETGTVKWFSVEKGYGFIERDRGDDLFAHRTELADPDLHKLETGQRVEFRVERSPKGPKAAEITVLRPGENGAEPARRPEPSTAPADGGGREGELVSLDEQLERIVGERFLHGR
jgi:CspA family cold shock protein